MLRVSLNDAELLANAMRAEALSRIAGGQEADPAGVARQALAAAAGLEGTATAEPLADA